MSDAVESFPGYWEWLQEGAAQERKNKAKQEHACTRGLLLAACLLRSQWIIEGQPMIKNFIEMKTIHWISLSFDKTCDPVHFTEAFALVWKHAKDFSVPDEALIECLALMSKADLPRVIALSQEHGIFEMVATDFVKVADVMSK